MEKVLKENEKIEEVYNSIRDICGTNSLKIITERILNKDKKYNENVSKVSTLQNKIEILEIDNAELEKELITLKNYVIVKETDNNKTISTIPTSIIEEAENKLIDQEGELILKLNQLQEKQENINLIYQKILENIEYLYESAITSSIEIEKDKNVQITTQDLNTTNSAFVPNESKLTEDNKNDEEKKEEEYKEENETEENKKIEEEMNSLYEKYIEFLNITEKRFDMLYLIKSKQEFINFMEIEGKKNPNEFDFRPKKKSPTRILKRKESRRQTRKRPSAIKNKNTGFDDEVEVDNEESEDNEKKVPLNRFRKINDGLSDDIFQRFLQEEEKKTKDFIFQNDKKKF